MQGNFTIRRNWPRLASTICLLLMFLTFTNTSLAKAETCPANDQLRPLLNSERIQNCFGSYGVEIIEQEGNLRISSLFSLDGDQRITRTLAISEFADKLPPDLLPVYQFIREGASMGSTLEAAGWRVEKHHRYLGETPITSGFSCMTGLVELHAESGLMLAVQVYDLWVLKETQEVRFALLAELHDPRYLTLFDLRNIYPAVASQFSQPDAASERLLDRAKQVCVSHD